MSKILYVLNRTKKNIIKFEFIIVFIMLNNDWNDLQKCNLERK